MTSNNEERALKLMTVLEGHLGEKGPWLFGLEKPSVLDAHVVPFIARMKDVDRYSLIPPRLRAYAETAWESAGYKATMNGRPTMPLMSETNRT